MDFSELKRFLDSLPEMGIPGVDMTVYQAHRSIFRHSAGFSDREAETPVRRDETYFAYSCTKPLTVVCALQLLEKGAFLMNDPLSEYLPEYRSLKVHETDAQGHVRERPAKREVRMGDLFTMTAGLDYNLKTPEINRAVAATNGCAPTREIARAIAAGGLCFDPGAHWQYSLCLDVLGAAVEVISGMRFETYMKKNLFEPLGMTMSSLHLTPAQAERLAAQYSRDEKGVTRIAPECAFVSGPDYDSGGAGLVTTVNDYIRFSDALACGGEGLTGERILSPASIEMMRENHLTPAQMTDFNWPQMVGYGYGLGVRTLVSRAAGGALSPVGEFGWGGAAGAYTLIDPEHQLSVYFAEHMLNSYEPYVHPRLRNLLYAAL